jgi:hypothetical protein
VSQPADDDFSGSAIDAFANLATDTAVDRDIVSTLTDENSYLTKQLEETSQILKEIRALLKKERNNRGSHKPFSPSLDNYCWTHGYKIARNHTSESFVYPKTEHNREASKNNKIWGSQANKKWLVGAKLKHYGEKFEDCRTPLLLQHHDTAIIWCHHFQQQRKSNPEMETEIWAQDYGAPTLARKIHTPP